MHGDGSHPPIHTFPDQKVLLHVQISYVAGQSGTLLLLTA
jgi:hypothetical protein